MRETFYIVLTREFQDKTSIWNSHRTLIIVFHTMINPQLNIIIIYESFHINTFIISLLARADKTHKAQLVEHGPAKHEGFMTSNPVEASFFFGQPTPFFRGYVLAYIHSFVLKRSDEELMAHSEDEQEIDSGPTKGASVRFMLSDHILYSHDLCN